MNRRIWITCPLCGWTSWSRDDVVHRFCGHCHRFHDEMSVDEVRDAMAWRIRLEEWAATRAGRAILALAGVRRPPRR